MTTAKKIRRLLAGTHYLAGLTQHAENNLVLGASAASVAVTTVGALPRLAPAEILSGLAQTYLSSVVPILAMMDGACRFALGFTGLVFAVIGNEEDYAKNGTSRANQFLLSAWEALKGAPLFYYGLEALSTGSFTTGCFGYALTNSLDCFERIISALYTTLEVSEKVSAEELADLCVKSIETAGWWLLAFGHPAGAICLGLVAAYKLLNGRFFETALACGHSFFAEQKGGTVKRITVSSEKEHEYDIHPGDKLISDGEEHTIHGQSSIWIQRAHHHTSNNIVDCSKSSPVKIKIDDAIGAIHSQGIRAVFLKPGDKLVDLSEAKLNNPQSTYLARMKAR